MVAGGTLIFASEIKAILTHPSVQRDVDLTGLDQIFTFPGLVSPRTMFKNISSLGPGYLMKIGNGNMETVKYWDLDYPLEDEIEDSRPESFYRERLDDLIRQAVKYRIHADVPVGFYLSGGVDSSLIAAVIKDIYPEREWHSFSIGFNDTAIDERKYQALISNRVGSTHHEIIFDWSDICSRLKDAVYHAESPLKESYDTCSLALSELVRENGFKVVLTGEGADELFAGYVGYRFDQLRRGQGDDLPDVATAMEHQIRERLWGDSRFLYERNFYEFGEVKAAIYSEALRGHLNEFDCTNQEGVIDKSKVADRHPVHKRSYIDFKLRISDHLLADHGDRVAYANSVEARYPFLDISLVEFVKRIPPNLLLKGMREKYILRKVSERYLPHELTSREKFAFVAPGSPYLLKQNIQWMNDLLSHEKIKREGFFDPDAIERLKKRSRADHFAVNPTFENDLLMIILTFEVFLERFRFPGIG
jgi:asparagine synthase (glutamine-hydrolysing)